MDFSTLGMTSHELALRHQLISNYEDVTSKMSINCPEQHHQSHQTQQKDYHNEKSKPLSHSIPTSYSTHLLAPKNSAHNETQVNNNNSSPTSCEENGDVELEDFVYSLMSKSGLLSDIKGTLSKFIAENGDMEKEINVIPSRANPEVMQSIYEYLNWIGMKNTKRLLLSESPVPIKVPSKSEVETEPLLHKIFTQKKWANEELKSEETLKNCSTDSPSLLNNSQLPLNTTFDLNSAPTPNHTQQNSTFVLTPKNSQPDSDFDLNKNKLELEKSGDDIFTKLQTPPESKLENSASKSSPKTTNFHQLDSTTELSFFSANETFGESAQITADDSISSSNSDSIMKEADYFLSLKPDEVYTEPFEMKKMKKKTPPASVKTADKSILNENINFMAKDERFDEGNKKDANLELSNKGKNIDDDEEMSSSADVSLTSTISDGMAHADYVKDLLN